MSELFAAVRRPGRLSGPRDWAQALAATGAIVAVVWALPRPAPSPPSPRRPEEPELVFMRLPPPAPAARAEPAHERPRSPVKPHRKRAAARRPVAPAAVQEEARTEERERDAAAPAEVDAAEGGAGEGADDDGSSGGVAGGVLGGVPGSSGEVVGLAQVREPPRLLQRTLPRYPEEAERDEVEGEVCLSLVVGVDGRVEPGSIRVTRSMKPFDGEAVAAVRAWRFSPAIGLDGRPVRVMVEVPVRFVLS